MYVLHTCTHYIYLWVLVAITKQPVCITQLTHSNARAFTIFFRFNIKLPPSFTFFQAPVCMCVCVWCVSVCVGWRAFYVLPKGKDIITVSIFSRFNVRIAAMILFASVLSYMFACVFELYVHDIIHSFSIFLFYYVCSHAFECMYWADNVYPSM